MTVETNLVTDEQIAREAQAGCLSSFEELVRRYENRIHRFVTNRCRNACDAQEVTQDVFVAAYRGMGRFDSRRSFITWLFTIARRKCIDYCRARRPSMNEILPEHADQNDPGVILLRREAEQDLWRIARRTLPEMQYDALWLRYAEDMEVADVAQVMKRTRTHVKVLLFRARLRLERELQTKAQPEYEGTRSLASASQSPVFQSMSQGGV